MILSADPSGVIKACEMFSVVCMPSCLQIPLPFSLPTGSEKSGEEGGVGIAPPHHPSFFVVFFIAFNHAFFDPQNSQFSELKADFDLLLEASWNPPSTISGHFWTIFGNFLSTCLASRFDVDF